MLLTLRSETMTTRSAFIVIASMLLATLFVGCLGRSPDVRHFTLGTQHALEASDRAPELAVLIGPIRLPDYLDRTQIVRRTGGGEIKLDEFSRWLGGFEKVLTAALSTEIRRQLGSAQVVGYPSQAPFPMDYTVRIHVDDWVVDAKNTLNVKLRWAIEGAQLDGGPMLSTYSSAVEVEGRSIEALVEAHDRAIAKLAQRLADELVEASSNR